MDYTRDYLNTLTVDELKKILIEQRKTRAVSSPNYKEEYINRILGVRIPRGYRYNSAGQLVNPSLVTGNDSFHARGLFSEPSPDWNFHFIKCNKIPVFQEPESNSTSKNE